MAPRLAVPALLLALVLALAAAPAPAAQRAVRAAGPLVCVDQHCRGYVSVPLDRSGRVPGHVELYVSEFLPDGPSKGVVFRLAGGPGQSSAYVFDSPDELWAGWTQVTYDDRGTGQSSRIACGPFVGLDPRSDIARCNGLLGPERAFYSTRDNAADIDAVRAALGVDKLAIVGTSYGTKQALAYAQEYPTRVSRLLLDSTLLPTGPDVYDLQLGRSVPTGLRALCGKAICARATSDIGADVAAVANALSTEPIDASVQLTDQKTVHVHITARDVLSLSVSTDLSQTLSDLLPSALRAAREGRPAELERLWWAYDDGATDEPDSTTSFSEPVFVATMCDDGEFPWPAGTPVAARQGYVDRAVGALPTDAFGVFGTWLQKTSWSNDCQDWESTGLNPLAASGFPDVPTLILSGDRDIRTPTENAVAVARLFPQARVLVSHGTGHSVLSFSECAHDAVDSWLGGGTPTTSCVDEENRFVLPLVPGSLGEARALKPGGKIGRTLAAVVATIDELRAYGRIIEDDAEGEDDSGPTPGVRGLVSGTADWDALNDYSDVPGVTLNGESPIFTSRASIVVGGSAAARGTLSIREGRGGRCSVAGKLGGRKVAAAC